MVHRLAMKLGIFIYMNSSRRNISLNYTIFFMHFLVLNGLVLFTGLFASIILKHTLSFLVFYFGFMIFRIISGSSWHLKDSTTCYIVSTALLVSASSIHFTYSANIISGISILIVLILAPILRKEKNKKSYIIVRKSICLLFIILNLLLIHSTMLTEAFFLQSISLIPLTKKGMIKVWRTRQ